MSTVAAWGERRPASPLIHLDSAAAARPSRATLAATARYAREEAELGAYVAQDRAAPELTRLHEQLGALLGVPAAGVALVASATAALRALLDSWPLPETARVGVVSAEWGPNLELFAHRGLRTVELPSRTGRLDVPALAELLATDPPDLVHLTHVSSHRGLVQPVAEAAALCRDAGVALWVDAAQALGHLVIDGTGADACYAPARKWLAGPRGVGVLAVAERNWGRLRVLHAAMAPAGLPAPAYLEYGDAHLAGRVGLANAVAEYVADGPAAIQARLIEVGRQTRTALAAVPGWAVADDPAAGGDPGPGGDAAGVDPAAGAITGLRPTRGQDVGAVRARLLAEHRILTTAGYPARAPRDMPEPLLRISPHVDCRPEDLDRLAQALADL